MRTAFMIMLLLAIVSAPSLQLSAQDAYRTNFTSTVAQWTDAASWQRFDSVKKQWTTASHFPTALDGVITIQTGDSVQLSGTIAAEVSIDQVVIDRGASLVFLNNISGHVTLNDGDGNDITVNGRLHIGADGALRGDGKIQVNDGGVFTIKNTGALTAALNNDGTMYWGDLRKAAGVFAGCHIVNNDTLLWVDGNITMDSATTFMNNGLISITAATGNLICSDNKQHPAKITNKGIIVNKGKDHIVDFRVKVDNHGTIGGSGTFLFSGGVTSAGVISPGASPGHLTIGSGSLKSSSINIEIATTGAVAGVNYDQLTVASLLDLAGTTINITDAADDSVNTEYTIIDAKTELKGRHYPQVTINAPSNFDFSFTSNRLVLKKTAAHALPVSWGGFKAVGQGNKVILNWNAVVDPRTSYFVIEHSTNAVTYTAVGRVEALHNNSAEVQYDFTFPGVDVLKVNYFRIKQVNADGRSGYSASRSIQFDKGMIVPFQVHTDPEGNELEVNIQTANVKVSLNDQEGKPFQQFAFQPGQHVVELESLPAGVYRVHVFVGEVMVETKQIVKR